MVGRGIRGQRRCATLWVGFHNSAPPVRRERAVEARSSLGLTQSLTREKPIRRKGEGSETTLFRDHAMSTTRRKRKKSSKVGLASPV